MAFSIDNIVVWFETYANQEKQEIETLFSQLTVQESKWIHENMNIIFTLHDDVVSMTEILNGSHILQNSIQIALRSIQNGDNLETHIIKNIPFDCIKFAFLILKRHLQLYAQIEENKNENFFKNSSYTDIYGFCKVFHVPNKMSVFLMNTMNIKTLEDWLSFDESFNEKCCVVLHKYGINRFSDLCMIIQHTYDSVVPKIIEDELLGNDDRLHLKLMNLKTVIHVFTQKWTFIHF